MAAIRYQMYTPLNEVRVDRIFNLQKFDKIHFLKSFHSALFSKIFRLLSIQRHLLLQGPKNNILESVFI